MLKHCLMLLIKLYFRLWYFCIITIFLPLPIWIEKSGEPPESNIHDHPTRKASWWRRRYKQTVPLINKSAAFSLGSSAFQIADILNMPQLMIVLCLPRSKDILQVGASKARFLGCWSPNKHDLKLGTLASKLVI